MKRPPTSTPRLWNRLSHTAPIGGTAIRPTFLLIADFLLVFLCYGLFIRTHHQADTYMYAISPDQLVPFPLGAGRPVSAFILWLTNSIGLSGDNSQPLSVCLLMAAVAFCVWWLSIILLREFHSPTLTHVITVQAGVLLSLVNVFFVSWFMFAECSAYMAVGICAAVIAVRLLLIDKQLKGTLLSFLCLIIATEIYQVYAQYFVVFGLILVLLRQRFEMSRQTVWQILRVLLVALAALLLNMLLIKIVFQLTSMRDDRLPVYSLDIIWQNIQKTYQYLRWFVLNTQELMPKYTTPLAYAIVFGCLLYAGIRKGKRGLLSVLLVITVFAGSVLLIYAPHLLTSRWGPTERTLFVLFALFSLLSFSALVLSQSKHLHRILALVSVCYLVLNIYCAQNIAMDQFITNALDKEYALNVLQTIDDHEKETGVTITKIAREFDADPTAFYDDYIQYYMFDTNLSTHYNWWACIHLLNYYGGNRYTSVPMDPDIYAQAFEGKNWDAFDPSAIYFQEDTAYLCIY